MQPFFSSFWSPWVPPRCALELPRSPSCPDPVGPSRSVSHATRPMPHLISDIELLCAADIGIGASLWVRQMPQHGGQQGQALCVNARPRRRLPLSAAACSSVPGMTLLLVAPTWMSALPGAQLFQQASHQVGPLLQLVGKMHVALPNDMMASCYQTDNNGCIARTASTLSRIAPEDGLRQSTSCVLKNCHD